MTNEHKFDHQATYQNIVKGGLDPSWSDWFDGFRISAQADKTISNAVVPDQTALHGILARIYDLGLSKISATKIP
jgi:hypothetical protein